MRAFLIALLMGACTVEGEGGEEVLELRNAEDVCAIQVGPDLECEIVVGPAGCYCPGTGQGIRTCRCYIRPIEWTDAVCHKP